VERKHKPCPRTPGKVLSEVEVIRKRIKKSERRLVRKFNPIEVVKHEMGCQFRLINRLEELGEVL